MIVTWNELIDQFNSTVGTNISPVETEVNRGNTPAWDSFKTIELILVLQKSYDIEFDVNFVTKVHSLSEIHKYLNDSMSSKK